MIWLYQMVARVLPLVPKGFVRLFARRYIAGETLSEAILKIRALNDDGFGVTLDYLGEAPDAKAECLKALKVYEQVIDALSEEKLDSGISVKLSHMGLALDPDFCRKNMTHLVGYAYSKNIFVRIDMEDLTLKEKTLDIYFDLLDVFPNVGVAMQAYLRNASKDAERMIRHKANIRICKGAYFFEDEKYVYKQMKQINESYVKLMEQLLSGGCFAAFATHDEKMAAAAYEIVERLKALPQKAYEFQMLYGVREQLRDEIFEKGHPVRIYVPFGEQWLAYCLRRLKENPKMAFDVFKQWIQNFFKKNN